MNRQNHHYLWLKCLSGFILLVVVIGIMQILQRVDLELLSDLKSNPVASLLLLLALFAIKAMTLILVPSTLLYLLSGLIFPISIALPLAVLGLSVEFIINYYMGQTFGRHQVRKLTEYLVNRHDKLNRLAEKHLEYDPLMIFLLRFLPGPPNNVTSLLLGSSKISFLPYFWPSMLGAVPKAVAVTIAGAAMLNPLSWQFLVPSGIFGAAIVISILWYRHHHLPAEQLVSDESSDN